MPKVCFLYASRRSVSRSLTCMQQQSHFRAISAFWSSALQQQGSILPVSPCVSGHSGGHPRLTSTGIALGNFRMDSSGSSDMHFHMVQAGCSSVLLAWTDASRSTTADAGEKHLPGSPDPGGQVVKAG